MLATLVRARLPDDRATLVLSALDARSIATLDELRARKSELDDLPAVAFTC